MKGKPWCHGGDAIYKRGRSWLLDLCHKGKRHKITLGPLPNRSAAREVAAKIRGDIIKEGHGIASRPASSIPLEKAAKLLFEWAAAKRRPSPSRASENQSAQASEAEERESQPITLALPCLAPEGHEHHLIAGRDLAPTGQELAEPLLLVGRHLTRSPLDLLLEDP